MPIDQVRLPRIEAFARYLEQQAPNRLPDSPGLSVQRHLLPFYEAYFSDYIEDGVYASTRRRGSSSRAACRRSAPRTRTT